ncbi:uncharacterized protein LY89DRAFT_731653 [Mollisia scopiformis]|uniref:Uncharacterized protein n=1 Tax=Mollisia scopiformis TaxID=149040 RepID=A0A194XGC5_MOLSC|nr:uncharacterized protein LY89DRAFT_731653 [Mollisia scopiformis]KUJ19245.1 hypothetical protein LY89DRAFT_731653 [Mollisia scopiformis]
MELPSPAPKILSLRLSPWMAEMEHPLYTEFYRWGYANEVYTSETDAEKVIRALHENLVEYDIILLADDGIFREGRKIRIHTAQNGHYTLYVKKERATSVVDEHRLLATALVWFVGRGGNLFLLKNFVKHSSAAQMELFFKNFDLTWTVSPQRRIKKTLSLNRQCEILQSNGSNSLPCFYESSVSLLENVKSKENLYMCGSASGIAVAEYENGRVIYFGDDTKVMTEATAHILITFCGGSARYINENGRYPSSGYFYDKIQEQRDRKKQEEQAKKQGEQAEEQESLRSSDHSQDRTEVSSTEERGRSLERQGRK